MGQESVNIISMNSARRGMDSMSPKQQSRYLQQLIEGAKPDICFLPGDNGKDLGLNVVVGFNEYKTRNSGQTVLMYDYNRVSMKNPSVDINAFGPLKGLDVEKLVSPMIEVQTLKPVKSVVKEFSMITWQRDLFSTDLNQDGDIVVCESLITFAQRFALSTDSSIFMGGEIPLSSAQVTSIVRKLSKSTNETFLTELGDDFMPKSYLPSMTRGSTRSTRQKFMMEVFKCSSKANDISDCFIASKELQLTEAKMLNVESVLGRKITMETLKRHAPVQTEVKYENRPPRHHGG